MSSSYLTPAEFRIRAFPSGSFDDVGDPECQLYLTSAAAEINASLRPHHTLNSTTGMLDVPDGSVKEAEAVIASYRILLFRGRKPNGNSSSEEVLQIRYQEIVGEGGYLQRLAKGTYLLDRSADATPGREGRTRIVGNKPTTMRRFTTSGKEFI